MTLASRVVLELAEAWYESWPNPPPQEDLAEELDLYTAVSQLRRERCPYWPSSMWHDLQEQVDLEARLQVERGEHLNRGALDTGLIDEFGEPIFEPVMILEGNDA